MTFPDFEQAIGQDLDRENREAELFHSEKTKIYEVLIKEAKKEINNYKGRGKDNKIQRVSQEILVDLLERSKELNFIPDDPEDPNSDYTITGNFVKDETFTWKENSQTTVINIFRAGTEVNISAVVENPTITTFSGNVGNVTAGRTLAMVANKYVGVLRKIDKLAREQAAAKKPS